MAGRLPRDRAGMEGDPLDMSDLQQGLAVSLPNDRAARGHLRPGQIRQPAPQRAISLDDNVQPGAGFQGNG